MVKGSGEEIAALLASAQAALAAGAPESAAASYLRALELDPGAGQIMAALGSVRQGQNRVDEASEAYERAIALGFDDFAVRSNLGTIASATGDYDAAIAHLTRASELAPHESAPLVNLGLALVECGRHADSLAVFDAAEARGGATAEVRWNRAAARLALGDYTRGWGDYEARWQIEQMRDAWRALPAPEWRGEDLSGKTLYLWHEQGFGDTLQFCRYVTLAAARGARVILDVQAPLARLCEGLAGVAEISTASAPQGFDYHAPLLGLPHAFGTTLATIPSTLPYLAPTPADVAMRAARLGPRRRARIGLAWSSAIRRHNDAARNTDVSRSLPLAMLAPLAALDVEFHSLQIGDGSAEALTPPRGMHLIGDTASLADFADTAALMANLDAVVAVDTAAAHLAGALGRPLFVLLNSAPSWRWLIDRTDSPWYPGARLYRQHVRNDWRAPVAELTRDLAVWLDARDVSGGKGVRGANWLARAWSAVTGRARSGM